MSNALSYSFGVTAPATPATTVTVEPPPACNSGDLLVMCAFGGIPAGDVHPDLPSGWTAHSAGSALLGVFTKTATGSESAYTVTFSATCVATVVVAAYPPATVSSSLFSNSGGGVVTWTPAFPSGVTSGEVVLLLAGACDYSPDGTSGMHTEELPAGWTPVIPPLGCGNNAAGGYQATCIGLCEYTGSTSNPTVTSQEASTFYTGFLVLTIPAPASILAVTATAGGAVLGVTGVSGYQGVPAIGMALTVEALTGAASAAAILAGGATAESYSAGSSATPDLAITPAGTGSRIAGALMDWEPGTAYTPAGNTTFSQNVYDSLNLAGYGTFHSATAPAAGSPVTYGATAPSSTRVNIALAEILAGGTIAVSSTVTALGQAPSDFTTPAVAQTAIFPSQPPAGALLVATVTCNSNYVQAGVLTMALADSSGLTWTPLAQSDTESGAYAGVWIAQVPSTLTAAAARPVTAATAAAAAVIPPGGVSAAAAVAVTAAVAAAATVTAGAGAPSYYGGVSGPVSRPLTYVGASGAPTVTAAAGAAVTAATAAAASVTRAAGARLPVTAGVAARAVMLTPGALAGTAQATVTALTAAAATVTAAHPPPPPLAPAATVFPPMRGAGTPAITYTYAATDLITGQLLADSLPLNVQSFGAQLNGGGTMSASLNLNEMAAVNRPFVNALTCRRAVVWALENGFPVWAGVVWDWPDMTRADGTLPISAQTLDTVWSHRLITDTIEYPATDLFTAFCDLVTYGMTKQSSYIAAPSISPPATRPAAYLDLVAATGGVAGLVIPSVTAGIPWTASYTWSDLTQVSSAWSDMCASGNMEYAFTPGLTAAGELAIFLQLGYQTLGQPLTETGLILSYPGNVLDYGYQVTGSQSANYIWATAPPNGSELQWQSQYPYGADLTDLAAGFPLMESTVSWQGSVVTTQGQVNAFADGQVALYTQGMVTPTVNVGGGSYPGVRDLVLGDAAWLAATSPLHPANADGSPGLQQEVRVTGWTLYPPGPQQSAYIQLTTSGVLTAG